jgi:hypothetical protein
MTNDALSASIVSDAGKLAKLGAPIVGSAVAAIGLGLEARNTHTDLEYDEWKAKHPQLFTTPSEEPTGWKKIGTDAVEGMFGKKVMTVPNWQGGGDAELYGAPGLSGKEYLDTVNLLGVGQLAGNLAKGAANKGLSMIGNKVAGGIAQGATEGLANFGTYGMSQAALTEAQVARTAANAVAEKTAMEATKAANAFAAANPTGVTGMLTNAGNAIKSTYGSARAAISNPAATYTNAKTTMGNAANTAKTALTSPTAQDLAIIPASFGVAGVIGGGISAANTDWSNVSSSSNDSNDANWNNSDNDSFQYLG